MRAEDALELRDLRAEVEQLRADNADLAWFYRMVESGGPGFSKLGLAVTNAAMAAAGRALTPQEDR